MAVRADLTKLLVKQWPRIEMAARFIGPYLAAHPELSTQIRERLAGLGEQVRTAQRRRGDAEKIRGMLAIVRGTVADLEREHGEAAFRERTTVWLERANRIELAVRLAEAREPAEKKKSLARLRTETDGLVGDVLNAMTTSRELPTSSA